jgi:hypothetical protein
VESLPLDNFHTDEVMNQLEGMRWPGAGDGGPNEPTNFFEVSFCLIVEALLASALLNGPPRWNGVDPFGNLPEG